MLLIEHNKLHKEIKRAAKPTPGCVQYTMYILQCGAHGPCHLMQSVSTLMLIIIIDDCVYELLTCLSCRVKILYNHFL